MASILVRFSASLLMGQHPRVIEIRRSLRLIPVPIERGGAMQPPATRWIGQNEAAMERA